MVKTSLIRSAAAAWSALSALLGVGWATGVVPFPFGANDPRRGEVGSLLDNAEPLTMGLGTAGVGLFGLVLAFALGRFRRAWPLAAVLAAGLFVAVPDIRVIQNFAYLFFGVTKMWELGLAVCVFSMVGGALWAWVAIRQCRAKPTDQAKLEHWRVPVTYAAALLALPYPIVRISWALGIPLGVPPSMLDADDLALRLGETGLGLLAVGGGILTLGLVRPWGETFPRWIPFAGGRRVPVWFAVAPAITAALMIAQSGLRVTAWAIANVDPITATNWGSGGPGLFFVPWAVAVALAAYAYYRHRTSGEIDAHA
ncbi:hypothetical protein [Tenggerimyces flavus]|uniref:DUF3995 domain-containing protein n=1 Tax=Tenggerimyces flavus TaxID=1708749 RepID=A0ABV7YFS9_9ACTN|nr:hypothetical protein [Tenggerimyces flavus]MBM7783980.1 hypothetical protein [Tenggerimyces flavus]